MRISAWISDVCSSDLQLLTVLRDEATDRAGFRRAMDDLSGILVYEAMRTAKAHAFEVRTPLGPTTGTRLSNPPLVVPVLRAGPGMPGGVLPYLPATDPGSLGLASSEERRVGKRGGSTGKARGPR